MIMNLKELISKIKNKFNAATKTQKTILFISFSGTILIVLLVLLFLSTQGISAVKLNSIGSDKRTAMIALNKSAHKGIIKANSFAEFKFTKEQKELLEKVYDNKGTCAVTIRLQTIPLSGQKELFFSGSVLPLKFGFLTEEDFSRKGKFISDIYALNKKISVQANQAAAPEVFDVSLAVGKAEASMNKMPEGFFVYSTVRCKIVEACVVPCVTGFDVSTEIPFYGFASNGGIVDFSNSSFDFSGSSLVYATVNTAKMQMPEYVIKFSKNKKSTIDNPVKIEANLGGEKYYLNNVENGNEILIPSAALKDYYGRFEFKENKECVTALLLRDGKKNASETEIITPIKTDPGLILKYRTSMWRTADYELYEWDRFPGILFFDTRNYEVQDKFFTRLAYFVEKEGFKGKLLPNEYLAGKHGYNAHDYSAKSMAEFFNKALTENFVLNREEILLKNILIQNGLFSLGDDGKTVTANEGGLVSISQETPDWSRTRLLAHEGWHTLYFRYPDFRNYVAAVYYTMDDKSLAFLLDYFKSQPSLGYDQNDDYLIKNEFMAYIMQQPLNEVADNFIKWAGWGTVMKYTPELSAYVKDTKGRGFEDAAAALNDYVFDNYGIVCGNIALINR